MTREYILQNLEGACSIWFMDEPALRDEVMSTLQDSLLIPKPKFKVGDRVYNKIDTDPWPEELFVIRHIFYNVEDETYYYHGTDMDHIISEQSLELFIPDEKEEQLPE